MKQRDQRLCPSASTILQPLPWLHIRCTQVGCTQFWHQAVRRRNSEWIGEFRSPNLWVFYCPKSPAYLALSRNHCTQAWRSWQRKEELFFISCLICSRLTPSAFHCSSLLQLLEVAQVWWGVRNQLSCPGQAEGLWGAEGYTWLSKEPGLLLCKGKLRERMLTQT